MNRPETFDVRMIDPGTMHIDIFDRLSAMEIGQSVVIIHDQNLRPLYFRLQAEYRHALGWETLDDGPEAWRVQLTRKVTGANSETIGDMVSRDYRNAAVFKKLDVDFSCDGKRTLEQVCTDSHLNIEDLRMQLDMCLTQPVVQTINLLSWGPAFLCRYLINLNHQYIKINTPFIAELAQKVAVGYKDSHPQVGQVSNLFFNAGEIMMRDILMEEASLFPDIVKLSECYNKDCLPAEDTTGDILTTFYDMMATHEKITADFRLIRQLTNNYQVPRYVSSSYNILYKLLQEYEDDLLFNFHLENNLLFPKVITIRNKIRSMQIPH
jgi:regulator of cell morphogenesis and NO signaling